MVQVNLDESDLPECALPDPLLDGGGTWTKEAIKGLYIFSFDMVSRDSGYAVALTQQSGVQLLKYRDNSTRAAGAAAVLTFA